MPQVYILFIRSMGIRQQGLGMAGSTVIIRVEDDLKAAFARAAKAEDRTASQLLRDFMRDFVRRQEEQSEHSGWLRQKAEAGRAAVRQGRVRSADAVEAYFTRRRSASLRKADKAGM